MWAPERTSEPRDTLREDVQPRCQQLCAGCYIYHRRCRCRTGWRMDVRWSLAVLARRKPGPTSSGYTNQVRGPPSCPNLNSHPHSAGQPVVREPLLPSGDPSLKFSTASGLVPFPFKSRELRQVTLSGVVFAITTCPSIQICIDSDTSRNSTALSNTLKIPPQLGL